MGYYGWEPAEDSDQIYWEKQSQDAENEALMKLCAGDRSLRDVTAELVATLKETSFDKRDFHKLVELFFKIDLDWDDVIVLFSGQEAWSEAEYESRCTRHLD
jgi:hypothetical protein